MSKMAISEAHIGIPAGAISQAYVRLRGAQNARHQRAPRPHRHRPGDSHLGRLLFTFFNSQAAQGVLEGFSAARHSLAGVPADLAPRHQQPYDGPAIAVDWTRRPPYAITERDALTPDKRRAVRWVEVYMRPVTFQILDRAAFRSAVEVLRLAHKTAVAVCLDGQQHRFDPTADAYRPQR